MPWRSPALFLLVGLVERAVNHGQSLQETAKVLLLLPIGYAVILLFSAVPALLVTVGSAGALSLAQRQLGPYAVFLLGAVAVACVAYAWIALGRYPNGDGGTMQSLVEQIKGACAMSIAVWCLLAVVQGPE